jgi:hypothetical protein
LAVTFSGVTKSGIILFLKTLATAQVFEELSHKLPTSDEDALSIQLNRWQITSKQPL